MSLLTDTPVVTTDISTTPFGPVLGPYEHELPFAFKEQFLTAADAPYEILLEGEMTRVWHRPKWLRPFFWLLSRFDLLFPETGTDIPAVMVIKGGYNRRGEPYHLWLRTFAFTKKLRRFNAVMAFNAADGRVVELLGPYGLLEMVWEMRFKPPDVMEIITAGCNLRFGDKRVPLPSFAYPAVHAVETIVDEVQHKLEVTLTLTHVWLGAVFGYDGTFQARRIYRQVPR